MESETPGRQEHKDQNNILDSGTRKRGHVLVTGRETTGRDRGKGMTEAVKQRHARKLQKQDLKQGKD